MENHRLRRILPALDGPPSSTPPSSSTSTSSAVASPLLPAGKTRRGHFACDGCRSRKSACDGNRPSCIRCLRRGLECVYSPKPSARLQETLKSHADTLGQLLSAPEPEAFSILLRLRRAADPSAVLDSLEGSMQHKVRPSDLAAARSISPAVSSDVEFELMALHPCAFQNLVPLDLVNVCLIPMNPFKWGAITPGVPGPQTSSSPRPPGITRRSSSSSHAPVTHGHVSTAVYGNPLSSVLLTTDTHSSSHPHCDDRLHRLQVGYWTRIPISNEVAANAISSYLLRDHRMLGLFDADLFLDDLITRKLDFCSPFLFSSLMYYACHTYAPVDIGAMAFAGPFLDEAKMLWQVDRLTDKLTTVAGIHLLCVMMNSQSRDRECLDWLHEGRCMADRMKLLGAPHSEETARLFAHMSDRAKRATAHTAWGVYNWLSFHDAFYLECAPISFPPIFPIPGRSREVGEEKLGVVWPALSLASWVGSAFSISCEFWAIMQEVWGVYKASRDTSPSQRVPTAFAESRYQKLLYWCDSLESIVADWERGSVHMLIFYMYFHGAIIGIFRPFQHDQEDFRLASLTSQDSFPTAIFTSSLNQLKRLLVRIHLDHPPREHPIFLGSALIHVFGGILRNPRDEEFRFYFTLGMVLCSQLYTKYRVVGPMIQGTLSMALRNGAVSGTEAAEMLEQYMAMGKTAETFETSTSAQFSLDLDLAMTAPQEALTQSLALQFEELTIFADLMKTDEAED